MSYRDHLRVVREDEEPLLDDLHPEEPRWGRLLTCAFVASAVAVGAFYGVCLLLQYLMRRI